MPTQPSQEEIIRELQLQVQALVAAQKHRARFRIWAVTALTVLAAGVAFAQPVITSFTADTPAIAAEVNANNSQLAAFSVPKNGILFIDADNCPTGWTQVALGRAVVGRPSGGTRGTTFGGALNGNVEPQHSHSTNNAGSHSHGGQTGSFTDWIPGTVNWTVQVGSYNTYMHRHAISADGDHNHSVNSTGAGSVLPYVYYTACRKD